MSFVCTSRNDHLAADHIFSFDVEIEGVEQTLEKFTMHGVHLFAFKSFLPWTDDATNRLQLIKI